jgi:hypothetical protein
VRQLQAFAPTFEKFSATPDIEGSPEKLKALALVKENLPKYVATLLYELSPNG